MEKGHVIRQCYNDSLRLEEMYLNLIINHNTVVSWVSAHGRLNRYWPALAPTLYLGTYPGVGACPGHYNTYMYVYS